MKAVINHKICDGVKECSAIGICPKKAIIFDDDNDKLIVSDKCTCCKKCVTSCPIGAIKVPSNEEEYKVIQEMVEKDPRTLQDLFVDRYGAMPLEDFFLIDNDEYLDMSKKDIVYMIEVFNNESINCLLKSIPIKAISLNMKDNTLYYKLKANEEYKTKYDIRELPALLFFKNNELLGKVEGYYGVDQINEFGKKIFAIIPKKEKLERVK